jgi:hypothetical protein
MSSKPKFALPIACIALATSVLASAANAPATPPARQSWGFQGQVHTALNRHVSLGTDPRPQPKLFVPPALAWFSFDPAGHLVEVSSQQDKDGNIVGVAHTDYDSQGRELRTVTAIDGRQVVSYNEYASLPDGSLETRHYSDGQLQVRTVAKHDAEGRISESSTYDANNQLINFAVWHYDDAGRVQDWMVNGPKDELAIHFADRYEGEESLVRSGLDPNGHVIWILSTSNGELTSSWVDPSCSPAPQTHALVPAYCHGSIGWTDTEKGVTQEFRIGDDGALQKTIQRHAGRPGNSDPDTAELYDSSGKLLEKLSYQYERDGEGNWTSRTVSAWDAGNNTLAPIFVDHRQITYY